MTRTTFAITAALLLAPLTAPAHAITCAQQAQLCAKIAREKGQPQYAPKCLAASRIAACRRTCVWTGTNGSQYRASGDYKAS